jgi:outer membrane protein OmpA-like peptidoglycan-associated protein
MKTDHWIPLTFMAITATGCQFSAAASGNVNTGGTSEGTAEASVESEPPEPEPAPQQQAIVYKEGKLDYRGVINFEYDKAQLRSDPETTQTLANFEIFLKEHADVSIEIEGHTDSRGSDDYNRDLSDRRAASVRAWLVDQGIAEDRVTAVGKGEDEPQVAEPVECDDKRPADTSPCETAWAQNRRVVFEVTGGAETLPEPEPPPAPEPEPEPEPEPVAALEPVEECPWLFGGHANAFGPNSWIIGAGALQPGVCWLEPSLGLGLGFGGVNADDAPADTEGSGRQVTLNVPLRARIWFMNVHAPIADVGLGLARYWISAGMTDSAGVGAEYDRDSTTFHGHLGAGYGYRPNGAQAGFRLGIVGGVLLHFNDLSDSSVNADAGFNATEQTTLQAELDRDSDGLNNVEPYGEISLGYLF